MSSILKVDTLQDVNGNAIISSDGSGNLSIPNLTTTGDINFGDNDKAQFGASQDLQIYHDGSNSKIQETGTGDLFIDSSNALTLRQYSTNSVTAKFVGGGASELYYANSKKFETTSGGINVTGTVVSDGLTVDTDTLYVDSSNNRVGVGTTSPNNPLEINTTSTGDALRIDTTTATTNAISGNALSIFTRTSGTAAAGLGTKIAFITENSNGTVYSTADIGAATESSSAADKDGYLFFSTAKDSTNATERMRIDSSGNVLVGATSFNYNASGVAFRSGDYSYLTRDSGYPLLLNRKTNDGVLLNFYRDSTEVGSINASGSRLGIGSGNTGLWFDNTTYTAVRPFNVSTNSDNDNVVDLGSSGSRFDDVYATNGTIQTSDQNEKQQISLLTDAEINVAKRISQGFKTYKWNGAVEEKGDNARTHTGVIAQEVQQAFADEGLDAGNYGMFISGTWWEKEISVDAVAEELDEEGNVVVEGKDAYTYMDRKDEETEGYTQRTRLGIRYPELLSFVSSAFEQRLTNIETRLTALEA